MYCRPMYNKGQTLGPKPPSIRFPVLYATSKVVIGLLYTYIQESTNFYIISCMYSET